MNVKSFKQFNEESRKEIVFTFGRFNPPTIGHGKLITKVAAAAIGNQYRIYASQSSDPKKNPLEYKEKIRVMRKMFPKHGRNIIEDKNAKTALHIASILHDQGFTKITMVVGSDRINEFTKLLKRYNGVSGRHGFYDFRDGIDVISAGERDPDAEGVEGMSASKMRQAAIDGDFKAFSQGLPKEYGEDMTLFNLIRKRMGLKEMVSFRKHVELETTTLRERYVAKEVFLIGDKFTNSNGDELTVSERFTNYILGSDNKKYLINKINEVKQDKDIKDRKGSQPAKYYGKDADGDEMSKSTKDKRAAHFKKGAEKDDDDPSAYKPAPGDATAKTKPSKYTKKFKDMFGESVEEGVNDPAIFKAVFLAGGPGSGKSFTVGKTGLGALGFRIVNSDPAFEKAIEKAGGTMTPEFIFSPKGQEVRNRAKVLTGKQMDLYLRGRLGLVVDGTGKNYEKIVAQASKLKELGYDVSMILVNTDLETAIKRDSQRDRTLGAKAVEKLWSGVQKNIGKFQGFFKNNFIIVDNSEGANWQKGTLEAYKRMSKFAAAEPKNPIARKWIAQQKGEVAESNEKGIRNKAEKTGISYAILKKVFDRGVAAWRTGHRPGTTPEQWGFARINSFATGGKTRTTADADLWAKHKGMKESFEAHWMYNPETGEKEKAEKPEDHERLAAKGWVHEPIEEGPGKNKGESWEDGYKRRVVKTTKPEHKDKGYNWRIKGKDRDEISIKLYKNKPDYKEFTKQMKRVAGHEFGN